MTNILDLDHQTLESFFYDEMESRGAGLPVEVEAYVVHLLARYVRRTGEAGRLSRPLATQYLRAKQHVGSARAEALRDVGDRALYIAGVVPRSLDRTPVDVRYVRAIGEDAYRSVAAPSGPLSVFASLAQRFETVTEVIGDIVEPAHNDQGVDLLALYERWRRTGDARAAKRLAHAGVLLDTDGPDTVQ